MAVLPRSHALAGRSSINVGELAPHPLLLLGKSFLSHHLFDRACDLSHLSPKILLESNNARSLLALVEKKQGIAVLPSTVRLESGRSAASQEVDWDVDVDDMAPEAIPDAGGEDIHRRGLSVHAQTISGKGAST
jgi:DNA-binding transcriptional LysR family regulator